MAEPNETKAFDDQPSSDLFELQLNNTGKNYIRRFYRLGTFILVANTFTCVIFNLSIGLDILQAIKDDAGEHSMSLPDLFYNAHLIVYNFINIVGVYFYVRFTKKIRRSIELNDEYGMNLSFKYFYINAVLFAISLIVSLVAELMYFMIKIN